MTERVLTEALISSESANNLTDAGERLFGRILAAPTTDAWGRRDAHPRKLRADLIPLLADWTDEKLVSAVAELLEQEMVALYSADGRWHLAVLNWDRYQRRLVNLRRGRSRHPPPPAERDAPSTVLRRYLDDCQEVAGGRTRGQPSAALKDLPVGDLSAVRRTRQPAAKIADDADWRSLDGVARFRALAHGLGDANERTPIALATAARGLPEGAIHTALESLEQRRRRRPSLESDARYLVATLTQMRKEGQYG